MLGGGSVNHHSLQKFHTDTPGNAISQLLAKHMREGCRQVEGGGEGMQGGGAANLLVC